MSDTSSEGNPFTDENKVTSDTSSHPSPNPSFASDSTDPTAELEAQVERFKMDEEAGEKKSKEALKIARQCQAETEAAKVERGKAEQRLTVAKRASAKFATLETILAARDYRTPKLSLYVRTALISRACADRHATDRKSVV